MDKSGLRHCATERVPKRVLAASFTSLKFTYKRYWQLKLKPLVKLLFVLNLSMLCLAGCSDLNMDRTMMKAAVDSIIDASFAHNYNQRRLKYFVASTASELLDMGYKWTQKALRNWR